MLGKESKWKKAGGDFGRGFPDQKFYCGLN